MKNQGENYRAKMETTSHGINAKIGGRSSPSDLLICYFALILRFLIGINAIMPAMISAANGAVAVE